MPLSAEARIARQIAKIDRAAKTRIYFVRRPASDTIKIGRSVNVPARVAALQSASDEPLELLGSCAGCSAIEAMLHRLLADYRAHGEWFHDCHPVRVAVAGLVAGEVRQ